MKELHNSIRELRNLITEQAGPVNLGEWITEAQARNLLKKGKSWFSYMRRRGYFSESKLGGTVFINLKDILNYLEKNKKPAFRK